MATANGIQDNKVLVVRNSYWATLPL